MDFADLVQSAEQLTTDCDLSILSGGSSAVRSSTALGSSSGAGAKGRHGGVQDRHGLVVGGSAAAAAAAGAPADLPRVERNLSQLVEAGQQLLSKTARGDIGGQGSGRQSRVCHNCYTLRKMYNSISICISILNFEVFKMGFKWGMTVIIFCELCTYNAKMPKCDSFRRVIRVFVPFIKLILKHVNFLKSCTR